MTMVELLVAMAIGVILVLSVSTLLVASENHKRTTTSTNDADQTGAYSFHALDRALRGAGSGIVQSAYSTDQGVLGCRLNAGSFLPRATALPAPFAANFLGGTPSALRVAPVLIGANQSDNNSSDVIVVMSGSGAAGGVPRLINGSGGATSLILQNTVGFSQYDLVLLSQSGTTDCLLEEVAGTNSSTLTLNNGAAYPYYTTGSTTSLATLASSTASAVTPLGNVGPTASPNNVQYVLFGVGTNNTLYSYDLLQNQLRVQGTGVDTSQAIADQVIQMNAIYGVASTANPSVFNAWAGPTDAGYDINTVMTTPLTQKLIMAVRVAIVVRGEYYDKNTVSPASLTLFAGLTNAGGTSLAKVINISATNQHYRYRVFEFTVPLRDMILLAGGP
jgi:type IV pilus assembly protein PilW